MSTHPSSWAVGLALAAGCAPQPVAPEAYAATYFEQFARPWVTDADGRWFLLDTGVPRTVLEPEVLGLQRDDFHEAPVPPDVWRDSAGFNQGTLPLVAVHAGLPFEDLMEFGGLIGMDLLGERTVTFDPGTDQIVFGPYEHPPQRAHVPVRVLGPGTTCFDQDCYDYGASRRIVQGSIDGVAAQLLVDTGAVPLVLTNSFFERLPDRPDRPGFFVRARQEGAMHMVRTESLHLDGVSLTDVPAEVIETSAQFARLQLETGVGIDGVIGYDVLRHFATTLHPHELVLSRVDDALVEPEDMVGLGVGVVDEGDCFAVDRLLVGGGPELQGLVLGDCLVEIDGIRPGDQAFLAWMADLGSLALGASVHVVLRRDDQDTAMTLQTETLMPHWVEPRIEFDRG